MMISKLIRYIGTSELAIEKDGFKCLVKYIVGQQISDKARETSFVAYNDLNSVIFRGW